MEVKHCSYLSAYTLSRMELFTINASCIHDFHRVLPLFLRHNIADS